MYLVGNLFELFFLRELSFYYFEQARTLSSSATIAICNFFFSDELRKFTISDSPKQTHFGHILITLFFSSHRLKGVGKNEVINVYPQMCLLRKITYGEFSEFVQEKKITYSHSVVLVSYIITNFLFWLLLKM